VVPARADDNIVAVAELLDIVAHVVEGVGADQAVGGRDRALDAGRAAAPGHRPRVRDRAVVPVRALDGVVAVPEQQNSVGAHLIVGVRADQAVAATDRALHAAGAAAPGHRAAVGAPARGDHQVVAT